MRHAIEWFDIPAVDFDRARKFYAAVFGKDSVEVPIQKGWRMALMPNFDGAEKGSVGGGIIAGEGYVPTKQGVVLYLSAGGEIDKVIERIVAAGGKILTPKHSLGGDYGYLAYFEDSEGNRLGLRSRT